MYHRFKFLFILILMMVGCRVGQVDFKGSIQGHTFQPDGTVFAWIDQTNRSLHVAMTWVVLDPTKGFDTNLIAEFKKRDALSFKLTQPITTNQAINSPPAWIQLDSNIVSALPTMSSVTITQLNTTQINGIVILSYGPQPIIGTFAAPVYTSSDAIAAANNWKLLGGQ